MVLVPRALCDLQSAGAGARPLAGRRPDLLRVAHEPARERATISTRYDDGAGKATHGQLSTFHTTNGNAANGARRSVASTTDKSNDTSAALKATWCASDSAR